MPLAFAVRFFAGGTSGKGPALSGNCPGMQGVGSPLRFLESRIFQNANLRSGANYMTEALSSSFSWRAILARPSSLPEAWPQTLTRHRVFCWHSSTFFLSWERFWAYAALRCALARWARTSLLDAARVLGFPASWP